MDGSNWTSVAEGNCDNENVTISFDPVQTTFLRITQTGILAEAEEEEEEIPWSMREMKIYGLLEEDQIVN